MSAEEGFLDLVYEAAVDPDGWVAVLRRFTEIVGGNFAAMLFQDQVTGHGYSIEDYCDPTRQLLYFDHYGAHNPLLRITDLPARPRVFTGEEKIGRDELARTEFYNDYMRKYDMDSLLIARLSVRERCTVVINVARSRRQDPFDAHDIATANKFHSDMVRAVRLADRFSGLRNLSCGLRELAERSHHAVFLVTAAGKICYMNGAAHALLGAGDGVISKCGVLSASAPDQTNRLHGLIAKAAAPNGEKRSGSTALERRCRRFPLSIMVSPANAGRASDSHDGSSVLVSIGDPEATLVLPEHRLREALGLTRTEARIAMKLLDGLDTRKTAEALGVSFYTVRAHLSRIFEKTGTHGQAALVGLLTRTASQPRE